MPGDSKYNVGDHINNALDNYYHNQNTEHKTKVILSLNKVLENFSSNEIRKDNITNLDKKDVRFCQNAHFENFINAIKGVYPVAIKNKDYLNSFNQQSLIEALTESHNKLNKLVGKYHGLCEIICNYITIEDSLGPQNNNHLSSLYKSSNKEKFFDILENKISKTHLLEKASIFEKISACLFNKFPFSVLKSSDQSKLLMNNNGKKSINPEILEKGLNSIAEGSYLKLAAFRKDGIFGIGNGHSMLIKKCSKDQYIFFDPNHGATEPLTIAGLTKHIDNWLNNDQIQKTYDFNQMCLMDNTKYLQKSMGKAVDKSHQKSDKIEQPLNIVNGKNKDRNQKSR